MEILVYFEKSKIAHESIILERVYSSKEIEKFLNEKYGKRIWYSYKILV